MPDQERHHRRRSTQIPPSPTAHHQIHTRLPRLFSDHSPAAVSNTNLASSPINNFKEEDPQSEDALSSDEDTESLNRQNYRHSTGSSFLTPRQAQTQAYSRAMHAHTTSQLPTTSPPQEASPTPQTYARTMHAFTLNQLNHMANTGTHNPTNNNSNAISSKPKITPSPNPKNAHLSKITSMPLKLPSSQPVHLQNQTSLRDEEPYGPSNTPEPAGQTALAPPPTSAPMSLSPNEMLAQGRELEARFEKLMAGPGIGGSGRGMGSEGRDWALERV